MWRLCHPKNLGKSGNVRFISIAYRYVDCPNVSDDNKK